MPALLQWCPALENPWRVAAVLCWCDMVGAGREIRRRVLTRGRIDPDQFEARAVLAEMMERGGPAVIRPVK